MFKFILASTLILFSSHFQENEFYVKKVFVVSEYNSRYILTNANQLISSEKKINSAVIQCFVSNLEDSGIFQLITTELVPLENRNEYELQITPTYEGSVKNFVIKDISLTKSFGIDEKVFFSELEKKKIKLGMPFHPYTEIEMGIVDVIESLEEKSGKEWKDFNDIWININLTDPNSINIDIIDKKPTCNN